MGFCPECRYEFKDHIKKCPDCEVKLVEELPSEHESEEKLVLVKSLDSDVMADMIKEALMEEGIPSIIKSDFFHEGFLTEPTSFPGSHSAVFVPEHQAEAAEVIIDNITE